MQTNENNAFLFLPGLSGAGVLVRRDQVVGARPNGPDQGAVVYTEAGPSIYTALTTSDLSSLVSATVIPANEN